LHIIENEREKKDSLFRPNDDEGAGHKKLSRSKGGGRAIEIKGFPMEDLSPESLENVKQFT